MYRVYFHQLTFNWSPTFSASCCKPFQMAVPTSSTSTIVSIARWRLRATKVTNVAISTKQSSLPNPCGRQIVHVFSTFVATETLLMPHFGVIGNNQGRRSHLKSEGAQGGYFFWCNFLLSFWAIWENDLFSKSQKVGGSSPLCPPLYAAPGNNLWTTL